MLPYRDSRITRIAIVAFFLIVLGYAYFEARGMLFGPSINVPAEATEVNEAYIVITGTAERISSLKMNGKDIAVTEAGAFEQPYLLAPGLNRIVLEAADKYGRRREKVIQIVYTPAPQAQPSPLPAATTTAASTTATTTPQ